MNNTKALVSVLAANGIDILNLHNATMDYLHHHSIRIPTRARKLEELGLSELRAVAHRLGVEDGMWIIHSNREQLLPAIENRNTESFLVTYSDDDIAAIANDLKVEESDVIFCNSRTDNIKAIFEQASEEEIRSTIDDLFSNEPHFEEPDWSKLMSVGSLRAIVINLDLVTDIKAERKILIEAIEKHADKKEVLNVFFDHSGKSPKDFTRCLLCGKTECDCFVEEPGYLRSETDGMLRQVIHDLELLEDNENLSSMSREDLIKTIVDFDDPEEVLESIEDNRMGDDTDDEDDELFFPDFLTSASDEVLRDAARSLGLSTPDLIAKMTSHQLWTILNKVEEKHLRATIEESRGWCKEGKFYFPPFLANASVPALRETVRGMGLADGEKLGSLSPRQMRSMLIKVADKKVLRDMLEVNSKR